jgi:hypothetical protein
MKKSQELSPDRADVLEQTRRLHAVSQLAKLYTTKRRVAYRWTEGLPFGPQFIRAWFHLPQEDVKDVMVRILNPKEDPQVVLTQDGAIAIWNPKPKKSKYGKVNPRFETFDFERGSSDDFHIIKAALKSVKGMAPDVLSLAEHVDQLDPKSPNYRGDTPR